MMNLSISNIFLLKTVIYICFLLYNIYIYIYFFLLYIEYTFDRKTNIQLLVRKRFKLSFFLNKCTKKVLLFTYS